MLSNLGGLASLAADKGPRTQRAARGLPSAPPRPEVRPSCPARTAAAGQPLQRVLWPTARGRRLEPVRPRNRGLGACWGQPPAGPPERRPVHRRGLARVPL